MHGAMGRGWIDGVKELVEQRGKSCHVTIRNVDGKGFILEECQGGGM